ncbi:hypothetical protein RN001_000820 [Aquatica leii]|uniref:Adenylate kinase isoenzyme 6 homolog n=1 Tax=Aquatica leii TaxID=1421715 RepID=A0AAN7SKU2_9COLE|nr:hypothetical protein RN001_000820 [Aquatica leii]
MQTNRSAPNILITGTPGVGKSTLCEKLSQTTGLKWLEISKIAKENSCIEEYDPVYQCAVLDEDKLLDGLEDIMGAGGNIVDYHSCELFPERWFDIVFVLRTDNTTLYDRLVNRGYEEEAKASYATHIVHELVNSNYEELESNLQKIYVWLQEWFNKQS